MGLVNWKDDTVKFDKGPYFTSVYVLYLLVKEILNINYPIDPLDEGSVNKFISSVNNRLYLSEMLQNGEGKRAKAYKDRDMLDVYVKENYFSDPDETMPFKSLPYDYGSAAVDGFEKYYKPLFISLFKQFRPYAKFWELSKNEGGIDGNLAYYNGQNKKGQKKLREEEWSEDQYHQYIATPEKTLSDFKANECAFMVVWEKGITKATVDAFYQSSVIYAKELKPDEFMEKWLSFLNDMDSRGLFKLEYSAG